MNTVPLNDLGRAFLEQGADLTDAVTDVLASGWYVHGPHHARFEEDFADFVGATSCVGVASGTDALVLSLLAVARVPRGDVVTAANAGGYTTAAALQAGFRPVYADVDPDTLCLTAATVEERLDQRTAAVVVTHLYGRMADVAEIVELCSNRGIAVVEDCAQSVGASRAGRHAGSVGDAGAFSFYPTKNLGALGDGGAVVTSDPDVAERVRQMRQYGWSRKYVVETSDGRNSRLDELQAAVLNVRLPHLGRWNARRRWIVEQYVEAAPDTVRVLEAIDGTHVAHLAVALTDDRDRVRQRLADGGVMTDVHYPVPDHRQPVSSVTVALPVTERAADRVFSLPCFPQLSDAEVHHVCDVLASV